MQINHLMNQIKNRQPDIFGKDKMRKSAVLIPLIEKDGQIHILFEVRSMKLRSQPGDICFPGGRIDPTDDSPKHCAIRETCEELGIDGNHIKDLAPLDYIVSDMGRIIYPYVGKIVNAKKIKINTAEVEEVFTVPLQFFLENKPEVFKVHFKAIPEENFPFDLIVGGKNYKWSMPHVDELFYQYEGRVIWGLTAKILAHLIDIITNKIPKNT